MNMATFMLKILGKLKRRKMISGLFFIVAKRKCDTEPSDFLIVLNVLFNPITYGGGGGAFWPRPSDY